MPQIINTNINSLTIQGSLNASQGSLATSLQRLSSGLRINSSKDDAAGLAISARMTSQIGVWIRLAVTPTTAISLSQTADGGLSGIADNLNTIRSLAVQSANFTNSASDRAALQQEALALTNEIQRVATTIAIQWPEHPGRHTHQCAIPDWCQCRSDGELRYQQRANHEYR